MSTDEITEAYRNGHVLSETSEILPRTHFLGNTPQTYSSTDTSQIYSLTNDIHYSTSDIVVITTAIEISVGLLGLLMQCIIKKEEERIILEIKKAVTTATEKASILEKLMPIAERIGERLFPKKT